MAATTVDQVRTSLNAVSVATEEVVSRERAGKSATEIKQARSARATAVEKARTDLSGWHAAIDTRAVPTLPSDFNSAVPVVLLPARIETRFIGDTTKGYTLRIRIYPDELMVDSHEEGLSPEELTQGSRWWNVARIMAEKRADAAKAPQDKKLAADKLVTIAAAAEDEAWQSMVDTVGALRAGWIAFTMARAGGTTTRPANYQRAARLPALPDRWLAVGYVNEGKSQKEIFRAKSRPVVEPLPASLASAAFDAARASGQSTMDTFSKSDAAWLMNFDAALAAGMALELKPGEWGSPSRTRIDRLVVVGLRSHATPESSADELSKLLWHHRYSRGLDLVAQGTPTNNTADTPSGLAHGQDRRRQSFQFERLRSGPGVSASLSPDNDGYRLLQGLGAKFTRAEGRSDEPCLFDVANTTFNEHLVARGMNGGLFPAILQPLLEALGASGTTVAGIRDFFEKYVRGAGPFPCFRVGNVPYGVLPVSRVPTDTLQGLVRGIQTTRPGQAESLMCRAIQLLVYQWRDAISTIPHVGQPEDDALGVLAAILRMEAGPQELWHALVAMPPTSFNYQDSNNQKQIASWLSEHVEKWRTTFKDALNGVSGPSGGSWSSNLSGLMAALRSDIPGIAAQKIFYRVPGPVLAAAGRPVSRLTLPWVRTDPQFWAQPGRAPWTMFLSELQNRASWADPHPITKARRDELDAQASLSSLLERLLAYSAYLLGPMGGHGDIGTSEAATAAVTASLGLLTRLASADEARRTLGDTLATCSYRIDSWITAFPTAALLNDRQKQPAPGSHLGAWAMVEDLAPDPPTAASESGGYIHAPSPDQATAAAVLRAGYLEADSDARRAFAINLSSARARKGLQLLEGVRNGQPLGALLGYLIERNLHDYVPAKSTTDAAPLDRFIGPLRKKYPISGVPLVEKEGPGDTAQQPLEAIDSHVIDGLALLKDVFASEPHTPEEQLAGLEFIPKDASDSVLECLRSAWDALDAVTDLLTAETIFQATRGNLSRTTAALQSMSQGGAPPEIQFLRSPRKGFGIFHRLVLPLDGIVLPAGWTVTPRAQPQPQLNAWVGSVIGPAAAYACLVTVARASSPEAPGCIPVHTKTPGSSLPDLTTSIQRAISLADLKLSPLDLLELTLGTGAGELPGALEHRIQWAVLDAMGLQPAPEDNDAPRLTLQVNLDASGGTAPMRMALEVAQTIRQALKKARPLTAEKLKPAAIKEGESYQTRFDCSALQGVLLGNVPTSVLQQLKDLLSQVTGVLAGSTPSSTPSSTALWAVLGKAQSLGLATFSPALPPQELMRAASALVNELTVRINAARSDKNDPSKADTQEKKLECYSEIATQLLGGDIQLLPTLLLGGAQQQPAVPGTDHAITKALNLPKVSGVELLSFYQRMGRVREGVGAWMALRLMQEAVRTGNPSPVPAQLPLGDSGWVGRPPLTDSLAGRLSLVFAASPSGLSSAAIRAGNPTLTALLLDEWHEVIPASTSTTGVAFQYDDAGAEAPQSLLIAVHPDPADKKPWDFDTLLGIVNDTAQLMKMRLVEPEQLMDLWPLLPGLQLPIHPGDPKKTSENGLLLHMIKPTTATSPNPDVEIVMFQS